MRSSAPASRLCEAPLRSVRPPSDAGATNAPSARRKQPDRVGPDDHDSPIRVLAELDIPKAFKRIRPCYINVAETMSDGKDKACPDRLSPESSMTMPTPRGVWRAGRSGSDFCESPPCVAPVLEKSRGFRGAGAHGVFAQQCAEARFVLAPLFDRMQVDGVQIAP